MGARRYGRILFRLSLVVVLACFAVWWVFYANKPAQQAGQLTVIRPDGTRVTLTLWTAEPRVDLPFTTDTAWVRLGQAQGIVHDRAFGGATGEVLVSPDCTQALVTRYFQGARTGGVLVDLHTAAMSDVGGWPDWDKRLGWKRHSWRTSLEPLTNEQLYAQLRSANRTTASAAVRELEARGVRESDCPLLVSMALDPDLTEVARNAAGRLVEEECNEQSAEVLAILGEALDDPHPDVRVRGASLLCRLVPGAPLSGGLSEWDAQRDHQLVQVREWWRVRQAGLTSSRPAPPADDADEREGGECLEAQ